MAMRLLISFSISQLLDLALSTLAPAL